MKNRKRFELKTFSLLHNGFLVCLSLYMGIETARQAYINGFSLFGNGIDDSEKGAPLAHAMWIFFISKPLEFIDTFIMVLKKNDRQISFLHMYHHVSIFIVWWCVLYYGPGGDGYFSACQNSFIHVIMYSYYFFTSLGIQVPWKSYVTVAQMTQFLLNIVQAVYSMLFPSKYPTFLAYVLFFYMVTLLVLFGNYFRQEKKRQRLEREKQKAEKKN